MRHRADIATRSQIAAVYPLIEISRHTPLRFQDSIRHVRSLFARSKDEAMKRLSISRSDAAVVLPTHSNHTVSDEAANAVRFEPS